MDILYNLGLVILMSFFAIIAGIFEDLESDVASTSNPNSQVQLAPQIGNLHKLFNRAVSGEPLLVGTMAVIAGAIAQVLLTLNQPLLVVLILSTGIATGIQVIFSITSYMGRITSQALYNQPLFMDVLYKHVPTAAAHAFINLFSITIVSYIMVYMLTPSIPLTLPIVSLLLGLSLGSIGSAVGDIHYGAEKLYQHHKFGSGIPVSTNGDITTKEALGSRNSIDVVNFCSKFAGPLTGLCFGIIIFLNFWIFLVFDVSTALIVSGVIVIGITILNYILERKARSNYGKYEK
ncbi:tetrahydromethanopterin S-methyltransferase subunit E [Methanosphaera sp. WGK6]|uniref:tetrahydromethanopterin S-methyltransferase subunit E n=1 Tax=Methanosphaera sp. WGK6 TaxID=1561964 RepID=UPI00084C5043|nr:tetrahydromethanopterin S-methyltransferase subunit E [Methanosphaera sp. WGK6]OED30231.1 tetrahydromethanopterin S-methyltransferase subunit E [Methanosphaera sp. WGK6]